MEGSRKSDWIFGAEKNPRVFLCTRYSWQEPDVPQKYGAPGGVSADAFSTTLNVLSNRTNAKLRATWPDRRTSANPQDPERVVASNHAGRRTK
jgi:hypothetical protein